MWPNARTANIPRMPILPSREKGWVFLWKRIMRKAVSHMAEYLIDIWLGEDWMGATECFYFCRWVPLVMWSDVQNQPLANNFDLLRTPLQILAAQTAAVESCNLAAVYLSSLTVWKGQSGFLCTHKELWPIPEVRLGTSAAISEQRAMLVEGWSWEILNV